MPPRKKDGVALVTEPAPKGRVCIRAKSKFDWAALLKGAHENHWRTLRTTIKLHERLLAGKPADLKAAEAMLKARGLKDLVVEVQTITDPVQRAAAGDEIAKTANLCEFHRRVENGVQLPGIWIPSNNVKAGLKECHSVLGFRKEVRGSRGAMHEGLFVRGTDVSEWICVGDKPDGEQASVVHAEGPMGPFSAIKRNEFVERPTLVFDIIIAKAKAVADKISDEELAATITHMRQLGLGACRSTGVGQFDVLEMEEVDTASAITE